VRVRLLPAVFELAAQRTRMGRDPRGDRAFKAARAILVDGKLVKDAALEHGINNRTASKAAHAILRIAKLEGMCPCCGKPL
jgi:hypothetical protein